MEPINARLKELLDLQRIPYEHIPHRRDFTAQETAQDIHESGRQFAKCVILLADDRFVMAVLPAHHKVELRRFREFLHAREVRLADEQETSLLFPDCETGAEPPFGNLYGLPVFMSADLKAEKEIFCNSGSHESAVRIRCSDYEKAVHPNVLDFSIPAAQTHIQMH